jgi:hypothetical protein
MPPCGAKVGSADTVVVKKSANICHVSIATARVVRTSIIGERITSPRLIVQRSFAAS